MIPGNRLSSAPLSADFLSPDDRYDGPLTDYERGGVALNDASEGMLVKDWICYMDGDDITVGPTDESSTPAVVATLAGVESLSFSFDRNMQPAVAAEVAGTVYFRWFDTVPGDYVVTSYPGARSPKVAHDDKRRSSSQSSDVLLLYMVADELRYRQQRDRFSVERVLKNGLSVDARITHAGMNRGNRFQIRTRVTG